MSPKKKRVFNGKTYTLQRGEHRKKGSAVLTAKAFRREGRKARIVTLKRRGERDGYLVYTR
jgi:hypothetical protein